MYIGLFWLCSTAKINVHDDQGYIFSRVAFEMSKKVKSELLLVIVF
jgi:hypothetical protein